MSEHIICVRDIVKQTFGNEPGQTNFLKVPPQAKYISIKHVINQKSEWINNVIKDAIIAQDLHGRDYGDILIYIHGYNNSQETVLKKHKELRKSLEKIGYKGALVSFDWPSDNSAFNYIEDRSDAKYTALRLVDDCLKAFAHLQSDICQINLHILAHSTGAYLLREAFDDADDRRSISAMNWTVSQIMIIAGDISANSMSDLQSVSDSLYRHCMRLTNYFNPYDRILKLSNVKRLGMAPRIGRVGLPEDAPSHAHNVNCGKYYDTYQNILQSLGEKSHSWYIGSETFIKDLLYTIEGDIDHDHIPTRRKQGNVLQLK